MDMKGHLKSALKQIGFDKPRKAQIIRAFACADIQSGADVAGS